MKILRSIDGVGAVFPRLRFQFPAKAIGGKEIFGVDSGTDIVGDGIPTALVETDGLSSVFRDYSLEDSATSCTADSACCERECCFIMEGEKEGVCRHPVPFVISPRLLELYNVFLAPSHNLARLPRWAVNKFRGLKLWLVVGRSYQSAAIRGKPEKGCLVFRGISRQAIDIGISVPLPYAIRWNQRYAAYYNPENFTSAVLEISEKKKLGGIVRQVKESGFKIVSGGREQLGMLIDVLVGVLFLIFILMLFASAIGVSQILYTIVAARKKELGLIRALGGSKRLVMALILLQGGMIGLLGNAMGSCGSIIASIVTDSFVSAYLPYLPFYRDPLFAFDWWIFLLASSLTVISCLVGAYFPARSAANSNPMEVLS